MRNKYQILVTDDTSKTLIPILRHPDYQVSFLTEPEERIHQIQNHKFDLFIIDNDSVQMSGLNLLTEIKQLMPAMPVLMISSRTKVSVAVKCIKAGASDFIEKPINRKKLLTSIDNILRGFGVTKKQNEEIINKLTKSELRILKLILEGKSNKEAAHILNRSERTIEDHRSNIMKKIQADNIVELVKKGIVLGLTSL